MALTIWHNPRCSKSRAALARLEAGGSEFEVRLYLTDPPDEAELRRVHTLLGCPVIDMVRTGESAFAEAGLTKDASDDALFAAMAAHPNLIQRPIIIDGNRAAIERP